MFSNMMIQFLRRSHTLSSSNFKLGRFGFASRAASLPQQTYGNVGGDVDEYADVEWDKIGFGAIPTDYMYVMKCCKDHDFEHGQLNPYANIQISPAAGVLNYGQGVYEGTKAQRRSDGRVLLFRPDQNAIRMREGAHRLCMPAPSTNQFLHALKQTVLANKRWIPPPGKGSLYIRPMLIGSGPILGLAPSPEYTFLIYASPVRNYFKEGIAALNLYVEEEYDRASPGGAGGVKSITNYAPGNVISTPPTAGTILPGITRKSIIEIARDHGYKVEERGVMVDELSEADEVFCTGTAVGVAPVGSITYKNQRMEFRVGDESTCSRLYSTLVGIQTGVIEDKKGWIVEVV
uniref:Branched-chain-amino-acid transaminase n=1 Tax=Cannabis sativa TaxID=3483 RepID=A0A803PPA3_CANSA